VSQPLTVALPPGLVLSGGYSISVDALDPTTGATVLGVDVSNVTVEVDLLSGGGAEQIGAILLGRAAGT
jgi:hypothetical protein